MTARTRAGLGARLVCAAALVTVAGCADGTPPWYGPARDALADRLCAANPSTEPSGFESVSGTTAAEALQMLSYMHARGDIAWLRKAPGERFVAICQRGPEIAEITTTNPTNPTDPIVLTSLPPCPSPPNRAVVVDEYGHRSDVTIPQPTGFEACPSPTG